jgi:demethoxyubiquinone hydroxylase (CLK1/Coq7/Cat5 family)
MDALAFWFQVIIASEPLLKEAIYLLSDEGFEGDLKAFYAKHLEEEADHAKWLREDLGDHVIQLHMTAAQLAGTAYYLIRHHHPVALMGYMMALEGKPISMAYVKAMEKAHGKFATRTLRLHAEEDPRHYKELMAFPIPEEHRATVEITRVQTQIYIDSLRPAMEGPRATSLH